MAQNKDEFKVCVESLHSKKIIEINYEGEEILEETKTVSQRFAELAQQIDFSNSIESDGSEPPQKKSTQKWPWESPHSKLKQALTEISVLSDVLQIAQNHRQYVTLVPVYSNPAPAPSSSQQYIVKKKSLERAADILRRGTLSLSLSSTLGEKEFHQMLSVMRQRWRLRRLPNGAIVGDLSYHSAGSLLKPVFFDVSKSEKSTSDNGAEIIQVTIPRDLKGRSEVVVFMSDKPIREIPSFSSLPPSPMDHLHSQRRRGMPGWEIKLLEAQNVLFNQELFSQITKEAYNRKPCVQQVFANRINFMLSNDCWLSILHMREYDEGSSKLSTDSAQSPDIAPRWHLVIALKQLLRDKHSAVSTLEVPRPATSGFLDHTRVSSACVTPLKTKDQAKDSNIFEKFIEQAKHCYNEERLRHWISEVCSTCKDPLLELSWSPHISLVKTLFKLIVTSPNERSSDTVTITLNVDRVSVEQLDGRTAFYSIDKDHLLSVLCHQVLVHQIKVASGVARSRRWNILQQFDRPFLSSSLVKSSNEFVMACGLTLESPDARKRLDVVLEWDCASISLTKFPDSGSDGKIQFGSDAPKTTDIALSLQHGHDFQQQFSNLLHSLSS